jgi:hypothetical protein
MRQEPPSIPPGFGEEGTLASQSKFRFSDLQNIQYIEEKTHELLLVLKLNTGVLEELRQYYSSLKSHTGFSEDIESNCQHDLERFIKRVRAVEKEVQMQHSRTETLLRLLAERKQFVCVALSQAPFPCSLHSRQLYGILQYQSMQASEVFAKRAQESAVKMEVMTVSMHEIAQKTKQETVSMRIITLVTLFFLPGTFIGVSKVSPSRTMNRLTIIQTFMSTDIVQIDMDNMQHFQSRGLKLYLAICIPAMFITFVAWYLVHRSVHRREKRAQVVAYDDGNCV